MNKLKDWWSAGGFLLAFFAITILSLALLGLAIFASNPVWQELPFPTTGLESSQDLNWQAVERLGGWGEVVDANGLVVKVHGQDKVSSKAYTAADLTLFSANEQNEFTRLAYSLPDQQTLVLVFPKNTVNVAPTIQLDQVGSNRNRIIAIVVFWLFLYLLATLWLAKRTRSRIARQLQAQSKAEQVERMQIFGGLAHDIKTPLAAIMAYTKALSDGIAPEAERADYLNTIYKQGQLLNQRVNSLLSVTSLERDQTPLTKVPTDILALTLEVLEELKTVYQGQALTLRLDDSLNGSFIVELQADLWTRCVENIVSNAIRHNPGGVRLEVRWALESKTIFFEDDGQGIPPEKLASIGKPFYKAEEARSDQSLSGIGLFTTQRILERLGWEMHLSNLESGGLRVAFHQKGS